MKQNNWLGHKIRKAREKKSMTQLELAKKLGYDSMQFVSLFERGLSKVPANVVGKLCEILNLSAVIIENKLVREYRFELRAKIDEGRSNVRFKIQSLR